MPTTPLTALPCSTHRAFHRPPVSSHNLPAAPIPRSFPPRRALGVEPPQPSDDPDHADRDHYADSDLGGCTAVSVDVELGAFGGLGTRSVEAGPAGIPGEQQSAVFGGLDVLGVELPEEEILVRHVVWRIAL